MDKSRLLDAFEDDGLALFRVQHDMRLFQRGGIIVEAADFDLALRQEAMAAGVLPLETPAKTNGTTSPSKVQRMECSGRTQRTAHRPASSAWIWARAAWPSLRA